MGSLEDLTHPTDFGYHVTVPESTFYLDIWLYSVVGPAGSDDDGGRVRCIGHLGKVQQPPTLCNLHTMMRLDESVYVQNETVLTSCWHNPVFKMVSTNKRSGCQTSYVQSGRVVPITATDVWEPRGAHTIFYVHNGAFHRPRLEGSM